MRKIIEFYRQVKNEAMRVIWVDIREVCISTLVILISIAFFSVLCLILDYSIYNIVQLFLNIGK
ncbi:preprotein translocase, SecE subunit [Orientia chuto str. Dubai]|uniref:Protein translocase subunit SecE n=1 Tax=Orientia chuto str. Dubai TaxID=1359168 RepID=A0A0F3MP81_9RICK|nr:preprotein translocase subunit SecE [Candidatus Orientia mediorientalis]KJV57558.1 preprotein translocase, SecE subunit [Orientia chuto str. Dubai]